MRGLLGTLLILGAGFLGIRLQSRERRRPRETLRDLTAALRRAEEEIRLSRTPLPRLFAALSRAFPGEAGVFLQRVSESMRMGEPPERVWRQEVQNLPLGEQDRAALLELEFQGDEAALCGSLDLLVRRLTRSREEREREEAQEARRAAALWVSGAALLAILLV